jgi:hypothetical protein
VQGPPQPVPFGKATAARAAGKLPAIKTPASFNHIRFDFGAPAESPTKRKREDADEAGPVAKKLFAIPSDLPDGTYAPLPLPPAPLPLAERKQEHLTIRSPPTTPSRQGFRPDAASETSKRSPGKRAASDTFAKSQQQQMLGFNMGQPVGLSMERRWSMGEAFALQAPNPFEQPGCLAAIQEVSPCSTPRPFVSSLRSTEEPPLQEQAKPIDLTPVPSRQHLTPIPAAANQVYLGSAAPLGTVFEPSLPRFAIVQATPLPALQPHPQPSPSPRTPTPSIDTLQPFTFGVGGLPANATDASEDETADTSCDTTQDDLSFSTDGMSEHQASSLANLQKMMSNLKQPRRLSGNPNPSQPPEQGPSRLPVRSASTSTLSRTRSGRAHADVNTGKPRRASTGTRKGPLLPLASSSSAISAMLGAAEARMPEEAVDRPLKGVVAFVDARTQEGDDASSVFVEMLKLLGAKVGLPARRRLAY